MGEKEPSSKWFSNLNDPVMQLRTATNPHSSPDVRCTRSHFLLKLLAGGVCALLELFAVLPAASALTSPSASATLLNCTPWLVFDVAAVFDSSV